VTSESPFEAGALGEGMHRLFVLSAPKSSLSVLDFQGISLSLVGWAASIDSKNMHEDVFRGIFGEVLAFIILRNF
jgi:hypothetical protein